MQHNLDAAFNLTLKALVVITDRDETKRLEEILREKHVIFHYFFNGMGTASSEILKAFGLSGTEKIVCVCMKPAVKINSLMTAISERFQLVNPGHGVAFTLPISGISAAVSNLLIDEAHEHKDRERLNAWMDMEAEKSNEEARFELVVSVINKGYSDTLMDAARLAGARGGTIIHARRMDSEQSAKFFGISIQAEKEIVAILINRSQKKELMQAVSKACGMRTEAGGIIFSLPVESCAGISGIEEAE